jgi:hypothetical protein
MKVNYVPRNRTSFLPDQGQPALGLPPVVPAFQNLDPIKARQDFAAQALTEGSNTAPARGGIGEGLARLAQGVFGGMMRHRADEDLKTAKAGNLEAMKQAFGDGDYISLLSSDDPIAQKLGSAVIEQQMKRDVGSYKKMDDGTVVWQSKTGGEPHVISHPDKVRPLVTDGKISLDGGTTWTNIPGFVENAKAIAEAKRAPKTVKPDDSGLPPWQRKW